MRWAEPAEWIISETDDIDEIPTLTSVVAGSGEPAAPVRLDEDGLAELEVRLSSASLDLADRLLHTAFQEMEAAMFEQVSNRLRSELPDLVSRIIREHFEENS